MELDKAIKNRPNQAEWIVLARESAENAILLTVAYANLFDAPLSDKNIHRLLIGKPATERDVAQVLGNGVVPNKLLRHNNNYALAGRSEVFEKAQLRRQRAEKLWPIARYYGNMIAKLPFVRMVAVTGSLAANNPTVDADIDYLLVTANDRLWITRLLTLFIVRLAERKGIEICPNYIIAERALTLNDRTLYTAHELARMVPLAGQDVYEQFMQLNGWRLALLPNAQHYHFPSVDKPSRTKRIAEFILQTKIGDWLERWEQRRKIGRLSNKTNSAEANFTNDVCKGHTNAHHQTTLAKIKKRTLNL